MCKPPSPRTLSQPPLRTNSEVTLWPPGVPWGLPQGHSVLPSRTVSCWAALSCSPASATSKLCGFGQKHFTFLSLDFLTSKRGFYQERGRPRTKRADACKRPSSRRRSGAGVITMGEALGQGDPKQRRKGRELSGEEREWSGGPQACADQSCPHFPWACGRL